ncbi:CUB and sushi domain-containing protein 3-like [Thrips palmi]|uniref:CUB and sushi domain-containing protein 3-like n=1 Tax=Thrips palmi TaxID=161013 RepID=A0A6P8YKJ7_THRPL|nr:CUB and sushi domain-containing protein 3-like [Thrips palmi]
MSISDNFIVGLVALALCQAALAGTCGKNFTAQDGSITSPGFPQQYENNVDCDWYISPNVTSFFYIRSISFSTEACCDKVSVSVIRANGSNVENQLMVSGTGPLQGNFFIDTGDVVYIHFHTDGSNVASGFRLLYSAAALCPESSDHFQCNDGLLCIYPAFTCDGVNDCFDGSDEWGPLCQDHAPCGGNITTQEGYITSPGWPAQCGRGLSCDWFISPNVASMVFLRSLVFDVGENAELTVSVISGSTSTEEFMSVTHVNEEVFGVFPFESGDKLLIHFNADNSSLSQGFQLYYSAIVAENVSVGDSLQATVDYQLFQGKVSVAACSSDSCDALLLSGLGPDRRSLAYESYAHCNSFGKGCSDDNLVNFNYPSGWTAFQAGSLQFFVSIREGFLSVFWNDPSTVAASLPMTSVSGKQLFITPLASISWISRQTTEGPSLTTAMFPSTTSASSTLAPFTTTSSPVPVTTSPAAASTPAPPTTILTTTVSSPTTVTNPQPAPTTTTPQTPTTVWATTTPAAGSSRPTVGPTTTSTGGTTVTSGPPSSTTSGRPTIRTTDRPPTTNSRTTVNPYFPTTPVPPSSWPPLPAPPACPADFPLRYRYLLIPVANRSELYVICFAGWGQSMKCPHPLAFSYQQQKCVWSWNPSIASVANEV